MRCSNCGWTNEEGVGVCVKCNSPLIPGGDISELETSLNNTGEAQLFSDIRTCRVCGYPLNADDRRCPACNAETHAEKSADSLPPLPPLPEIPSAPVASPAPDASPSPVAQAVPPVPDVPPVAESSFQSAPGMGTIMPGAGPDEFSQPNFGATVNPWSMGAPLEEEHAFTLEKVKWVNESQSDPAVEFSGSEHILNRANTDELNNSITSREQARIAFENGEWVLENLSEYSTTFVRADRKIALKDGDVIMMGNRMFTFRTKS